MSRFSLRTAFAVLAVLCAALAIVRAVTRYITPITVTSDRPDLIAYLDGEELGPVPARISWSRLYGLYGMAGTGPFHGASFESNGPGMFCCDLRRPNGHLPLIYLKPVSEADAERDGLILVDSPHGRIVEQTICSWNELNRTLRFEIGSEQRSAPISKVAKIGRVELQSDGQLEVEIGISLELWIKGSFPENTIRIDLSRGTFVDWRGASSTSELVEIKAMRQENGWHWHTMSIQGESNESYQWLSAGLFDSEGYPIPGLGARVPKVTLKDGMRVSLSAPDAVIAETAQSE